MELIEGTGIPLVIASGGVRLFIQAIAPEIHNLQIPLYTHTVTFQNNRYEIIQHNNGAIKKANLKATIVSDFIKKGAFVIYLGDARSDLEPATLANMVFAKRELAVLCSSAGIEHRLFYHLAEVLEILWPTGRKVA